MVSASQDLPESQRMENARRLLDAIPTLAWSARSDGSALFFNQRWLDYTGLTSELASGWGWAVALHPDESERLLDYWRSVVASGQPSEMEGRLRRFDGVYRWFLLRATPSLDSDGRVVEWFGTSTDIEDRKRAEDALRASEQNLRLMINGLKPRYGQNVYISTVSSRKTEVYFGSLCRNRPCYGDLMHTPLRHLPYPLPNARLAVRNGDPRAAIGRKLLVRTARSFRGALARTTTAALPPHRMTQAGLSVGIDNAWLSIPPDWLQTVAILCELHYRRSSQAVELLSSY
jgi:PAS domain S-box-containing protein